MALLGGARQLLSSALRHAARTLWFTEGRAVLSRFIVAVRPPPRGRLYLPGRADLLAGVSIDASRAGLYFALLHLATLFVPTERTSIRIVLRDMLPSETFTPAQLAGSALTPGGLALAAWLTRAAAAR
jgi:hypothetical protein